MQLPGLSSVHACIFCSVVAAAWPSAFRSVKLFVFDERANLNCGTYAKFHTKMDVLALPVMSLDAPTAGIEEGLLVPAGFEVVY